MSVDTTPDADADGEQYYLVSSTATTKRRHQPDESGDEPACRAHLRREDAHWRKMTARQTVFYDDCTACFDGGDA